MEATVDILWMIVVGLVAGALAKLLMPGDDPGGLIATTLLGIAGSFVGGFLARTLGMGVDRTSGLIGSVLGAIILLFLYRLVVRRRRPVTP
jgi:uncharacterized membrane protein YeaQ/YmgE (transglycosylase-associated protein family)